jgi:hypothetical protein
MGRGKNLEACKNMGKKLLQKFDEKSRLAEPS